MCVWGLGVVERKGRKILLRDLGNKVEIDLLKGTKVVKTIYFHLCFLICEMECN